MDAAADFPVIMQNCLSVCKLSNCVTDAAGLMLDVYIYIHMAGYGRNNVYAHVHVAPDPVLPKWSVMWFSASLWKIVFNFLCKSNHFNENYHNMFYMYMYLL